MESLSVKERIVDEKTSVSRLKSFLSVENISYVISHKGDLVKTFFCEVEDKNGYVSSGLGKGFGLQAMASAIAEAIEHYYFDKEDNNTFLKQINFKTENWFQEGSPNFYEITGKENLSFSCNEFFSLKDESSIFYPAFLLNPKFISKNNNETSLIKKHSLERYSCNSGTASGLNENEAILHGLLELIERDAIGVFLLESIINSKNNYLVRIINKETLPNRLKEKLVSCEKESNGKFTIIDITTELNIPSILVKMELNNGAVFFASGSSLSLEYSIERALVEAVQCKHSQENFNFPIPINTCTIDIDFLPKYARCQMDKGILLYNKKELICSYDKLLSKYGKKELKPLKTQIDYIVNLLWDNNIESYYREIYTNSQSGISICQVVAPKLERFFLVSCGMFILPSKRGENYLKNTIANNVYN